MKKTLTPFIAILLAITTIFAAEQPLRPGARAIPGTEPSAMLRYQNPAATSVVVAGSWDAWAGRSEMALSDGVWILDTRPLPASFGQHEFKFIVNGEWETGENRLCYINNDGLLDRPSELIHSATIDDRGEINVLFRRGVKEQDIRDVRFVPDLPVRRWSLAPPREGASRQGYFVAGSLVTFVFDESVYGLTLNPGDRVTIAGNFNGWDSSGGGGRWLLQRQAGAGRWEISTQLDGLRAPPGERDLLFKFVINGNRWLPPPEGAANALSDGKGNVNLRLDPASSGSASLRIETENPIPLSEAYVVIIDGLTKAPAWLPLTPGRIFDQLVSDKPLGVILDRENHATTYRLFAPRARSVHLCIFDTPEHEVHKPEYKKLEPAERYPMWLDEEDGVWEISLLGLDIGKYYSFNVDGPTGNGEGFNALAQIGDPYARAAAHGRNNCIVIDPEATNRWFEGWTDDDYVQTPRQDVVIYEMHVRGMTMHPSSGVAPELRGRYEGLIGSLGTGTGLDYLKDLGVTTIELLPTVEFNGNPDEYNWGYAPILYFAPEASYGRDPLKGSHYYEFKRLVNELHRQGFGVVIDVVFNHVGSPNFFHLIDKKYYFRLNPDFSYISFSGCGNDVKTEALMMRRLIVDNIVYWMKEFKIDGFRFDLAELIDMDTMLAIRDAAFAINTNVLLISEPWSFRGENKHQLKGTGWSAWNNDFRYAAKDFAMGRHNRDWLAKKIAGSVDTWAADPRQAVNYVESHDDMALADEFCTRPDRDGRNLQPNDVAANRLAATILFTSLGLPMIHEGQEFLRSKRGISNSYNRGDEVNAVRWGDRDRPLAAEALAYYRELIHLRRSPEGNSFRVSSRPPASYYRWIRPREAQALGYIVNAPRIHPGNGFIVLLNAGGGETAFSVNLPPGRWKMIGDGERIHREGLPNAEVLAGGQEITVRVPGIRAFIFMDGF